VECIAKGKVHKKYEFGDKASIAPTNKGNFIVGTADNNPEEHRAGREQKQTS
jgi:hypothetical protein